MTSNYAKVTQRYVFGGGSRSNRTTASKSTTTRRKDAPRPVDAPVPQNSTMKGGLLTTRRRRKYKVPSSLPIAMSTSLHRRRGTTTTKDMLLSGDSQPSTVSISSVIDPPSIVDDTMPMSQLTMTEFSQEPTFSAPASSASQGSSTSALVHNSQLHQPSGSHGSLLSTRSQDISSSLLSSSGQGSFRRRRTWMQRARGLIPTKTALPPPPPAHDSEKNELLEAKETEETSEVESLQKESSESSKLEPFGSKITDHFKPKQQESNNDADKIASLAQDDNEMHAERSLSLQKIEQDIMQRLSDKEQSIIDKIILQLKEQSEATTSEFTEMAKKIAAEEIVKIQNAGETKKTKLLAVIEDKGKEMVDKLLQASLEEITKIGQAGGAMITKINDFLPSIKTVASKAIEDVLAVAKNATGMLSGTKRKQQESVSSSNDSVCVTPLKKRMRSERRKAASKKTSASTVTSRSTTQLSTSKASSVTQPSTGASSRTSKRSARSTAVSSQATSAKRRKIGGLSPMVQTPLVDTAGVTKRVPTSVTVRLPFEESIDAAAPTPSTGGTDSSFSTPPRNKNKPGRTAKSTNDSSLVIGIRREDGSIVYASDDDEEGTSKSSAPPAAAATRKEAKSSKSSTLKKSSTTTRKTYSLKKHHGGRKKKTKASAGASSSFDLYAFSDDDAFKFLGP